MHSWTLALLLLLSLPAMLPSASAETTPVQESESPFFNGSFFEVGVRAGGTHAPGLDGWVADLGVRHSFPMHLLDTRISYQWEHLAQHETNLAVNQHVLGVYLGFHPLYLFLLGSDRLSYFIASFYLEVGAAMDATTSRSGSSVGFGFRGSLGLGVDVPLHDPDSGSGLWIQFLYRAQRQTERDPWNDPAGLWGTGFIGLAWRENGVVF